MKEKTALEEAVACVLTCALVILMFLMAVST